MYNVIAVLQINITTSSFLNHTHLAHSASCKEAKSHINFKTKSNRYKHRFKFVHETMSFFFSS